jgi:hypothetical protein
MKMDLRFIDPRVTVTPGPRMVERMEQVLQEAGAGMVYADAVGHPRINYQSGSIRDNFDFGPVVGISQEAVRDAGKQPESKWGAMYDLRLRISERWPIETHGRPERNNSITSIRETATIRSRWNASPRNICGASALISSLSSSPFRLRLKNFR